MIIHKGLKKQTNKIGFDCIKTYNTYCLLCDEFLSVQEKYNAEIDLTGAIVLNVI